MTYRPQVMSDTDRKRLDGNYNLWFTDKAAGNGYIGPTAGEVAGDPNLKKYLTPPNIRIDDTDSADGAAFSSLRTFWVLQGPRKGIWGINVTSYADIKQAQDAGSQLPSGYLARIGDLPPPNVMAPLIASPGKFEPNFADAYNQLYQPQVYSAANAPMVAIQAKELSVNGNVIWVANSDSESKETNALNPHSGVSILPDGAWSMYMGQTVHPMDKGLKYPLLTFDASTGKIDAAVVEFTTVMSAAKAGDPAAIAALGQLNIPIA